MLLSGTRAEIFLQPSMMTNVMCKSSPWSTWRTMLEHILMLQPMEGPTLEQRHMSWSKLQPMEISHWNRLLGGTAVCGEKPMQKQVFWQDRTPWTTPMGTVCFWRTVPSGKGPCWSNSWRTVSHGNDPIMGQRRSVRRKEERWSAMNGTKPPFSLLCLKGSREKAQKWN